MKKLKLTLALILIPQFLQAWSTQGHQTVALLAEMNIQKNTKQKIKEILNGQTMVSVALWADKIKFARPETRGWHFVDISIKDKEFNLASYCKDGNCITEQIKNNLAILKDTRSSHVQKNEALKFIIHLVGDVHQPLHCSNDNDRGGNQKQIRFMGLKMNLHSLWDHIITKKDDLDYHQLAIELNKNITIQQINKWIKSDVEEWAFESWTIAKDTVYPNSPNESVLLKDYQDQMQPICKIQLQKAGFRLAFILDQIFK